MSAPAVEAFSSVRTDSLERAVADLAAGRPVVVLDAADREDEGDLVMAAGAATPAWIGLFVRYGSGLLCAPMSGERADALGLPLMMARNEESLRTAYTVTVDAREGVTTGISAADRARTLRVLADSSSGPDDLVRPGHVLPLRAVAGGVRARPGHTEASVDLLRLAGVDEVAVIVELVEDDGSMRRAVSCRAFCDEHDLALVTIEALVAHLTSSASPTSPAGNSESDPIRSPEALGTPDRIRSAAGDDAESDPMRSRDALGTPDRIRSAAGDDAESDPMRSREALGTPDRIRSAGAGGVERVATTRLPTRWGEFTAHAYRAADGADHVALVLGDVAADEPVLVRAHSECLTGDALGSLRCDCGPQLESALRSVARAGRGVVLYLRGHEGRGIGLAAKLAAYALQDAGRDTVDANLDLGLPVDARDYAVGAAVLADLGVRRVRLLTNNPAKASALRDHDLDVTEVVPVLVEPGPENARYLRTKAERMGHVLPQVARGPESSR